MSKDRLLSDDGLRAEIANVLLLDRQTMEPYVSVVDDLINLVNTQKRLYAEMIINIDTDVDIPEALKKIYSDGYSKGYNDRTYENSYNSDDFRMAEAIAPAVAKVRSRYDKQCKIIRTEKEQTNDQL